MSTVTTTMVCHQPCRNTAKTSWLQSTLADLEQRFQALALHRPEDAAAAAAEVEVSDSFADRAEYYYQKRPQLISLLHDLYNRYMSLADRYVQAVLKPDCRSQSQISLVPSDLDDADTVVTDLTVDPDPDGPDPPYSSDAESSLSYQTPAAVDCEKKGGSERSSPAGEVIAELVSRAVENEILKHEMGVLEKHQSESSRKVELQKSLLEVLESERMVLLSENARLAYQATAVAEENEGLAAEVGFMRRKAGELARCVVKLREDHRVCMLGRKIEALQAQIYGLEKRNRECYEVMARREEEKAELVRGVCLELERVKAENKRLSAAAAAAAKKGGGKWWGRQVAKRVEGWVICGSHVEKHDK